MTDRFLQVIFVVGLAVVAAIGCSSPVQLGDYAVTGESLKYDPQTNTRSIVLSGTDDPFGNDARQLVLMTIQIEPFSGPVTSQGTKSKHGWAIAGVWWAIAGVWPCVRFSTETDGQSTFHQDGLVSRRNHSPALVIACVFRERSDRCDAHEVRCNLRHDAATRNLERTRRQARRPGWPPHDVARWHDAARRNATRSGEAAVKVAMVQRPESPRHVANG
jgi:hypothetical protein